MVCIILKSKIFLPRWYISESWFEKKLYKSKVVCEGKSLKIKRVDAKDCNDRFFLLQKNRPPWTLLIIWV